MEKGRQELKARVTVEKHWSRKKKGKKEGSKGWEKRGEKDDGGSWHTHTKISDSWQGAAALAHVRSMRPGKHGCSWDIKRVSLCNVDAATPEGDPEIERRTDYLSRAAQRLFFWLGLPDLPIKRVPILALIARFFFYLNAGVHCVRCVVAGKRKEGP